MILTWEEKTTQCAALFTDKGVKIGWDMGAVGNEAASQLHHASFDTELMLLACGLVDFFWVLWFPSTFEKTLAT